MLPRRVRPDDVHLPPLPGAPGSRKRRRPRAPPAASRVRPGERALLLHLPAFGRDLYLQLRHDLRFLSRGFEVEEAGAAGRRGRPAELCFYSGRVLGHPGSLVSLSACGAGGGLVLPAPPPVLPVEMSPCRGWSQGRLGWGWRFLGRKFSLQGCSHAVQREPPLFPPGPFGGSLSKDGRGEAADCPVPATGCAEALKYKGTVQSWGCPGGYAAAHPGEHRSGGEETLSGP